MKHPCLKVIVFFLLYGNITMAQNFPLNGGFENWTGNLPDHWTMLSGSGPISQGSPFSGIYSATLGMVYDGSFDWWGGAITQTDTNAYKPTVVTGHWTGSTWVRIKVDVYDAANNLVGGVDSTGETTVGNWTGFGYPIAYTSSATPYRTVISIINTGVTMSNGCSLDSVRYIYTPTGISESENSQMLKLYPNPATSFFTIHAQEKGVLKFYNSMGDLVKTFVVGRGENTLSTSHFTSGCYAVSFSTNQGYTTRKLIIQ